MLANRAVVRIARQWKKQIRKGGMIRLGLRYFPPNYIFRPAFNSESIVIDCGCGYEAELSQHLIGRFGLRAFGVDPTQKHGPVLNALSQRLDGRFVHLPLAVGALDGMMRFSESVNNESGSLLGDHVNVLDRAETRSYDVQVVSLRSLVQQVKSSQVDLLKLDLEGAEYELLGGVSYDDVAPFAQIFVEFHHHAVQRYSPSDTAKIVERVRGLGFSSYSIDDHNFLFWQR